MMNQSAQGLASLGRNGDTMLMHVNPDELRGLQGLAMAQGGSLTINPDTGLPEAFKIKNLFKAALPIAAGFMFPDFGIKFMGGMFGKGVAAGALAGAGISALSGENPLLGALTGGLGGYGGAGLAGSAANVGKGTIANVADDVLAVPSLPAQGAGTSGAMGFSETGQTALSGLAPGQGGLSLQTAAPNAIKDVISTTTPLEIAGENFGTLMKNPLDVMKDYGYGSSAMLAGGPLLAGLEPSDLGYETGSLYNDPDKGKYRGPQGQLNLSDRFDTGLRLVAKGGYIDGYAMGGAVQSSGIRDLYGTPDNPPAMSSGLGGFGLGRLNDLASEQARSQAQTLGYDEGGAVGSGDASGDAVTAETTSAPADYAGMSYDALVASGIHPMNAAALKGMPMPGMSSPAPSTYMGSESSMSGISSLAPSISYMPSTSYGAGTPEYIGGMPSASYIESMGYRGGMPTSSLFESMGYRGSMPSPSLSEGRRKLEYYAEGGDVGQSLGENAVDENAPNPEGVVSKYTTVVDDEGISSRVRVPYQYEKIITKGAEDFYNIPPIEYAANLYPGAILPKFKKEGYADGGDVGMNIEKQQALNLDRLPTLNVNLAGNSDAYNPTPFDITKYTGYMTPNTEGSLRMAHMVKEATKADATPFNFSNYSGYMTPNTEGSLRMAHMVNNFKPGAQEAFKNFITRPRYAQGGYLDGQGDGMSDSIPATIEGKQPARLADGEFVIPADVVSHIGNGSSKAGSKRLYAMLDKVRQARTGHTKQGKQIKAEKYLPA